MIIRKYGIVLSRLKKGDIELVRQMRNSTEIRKYMHYREEISPEMQKKWFLSINNMDNYYYIIEYNGKKIGLIHGKNNDFEKGICEGGIFIWDRSSIGTFIPALASVILNDFTFHTFHRINTVYAKVVEGNKTAEGYNKLMGYEPCLPMNDDKNVYWMKLTKESYLRHITALRKGVAKLTGDDTPLSPEEINFSDDSQADIDKLYKNLPHFELQAVSPIIKRAGLKI
jgi:hypothetical protein